MPAVDPAALVLMKHREKATIRRMLFTKIEAARRQIDAAIELYFTKATSWRPTRSSARRTF